MSQEVNLCEIAHRTDGFSGSDIRLLCKEVAMKPIRRLLDKLEAVERGALNSAVQGRFRDMSVVAPERLAAEVAKSPISPADVEEALAVTRPSAQGLGGKYLEWQKEFGAA